MRSPQQLLTTTKTLFPKIDVIPSRADLGNIDETPVAEGVELHQAMVPVNTGMRNKYDYILIDTEADSSAPATFCAYCAADYVLVVIAPEIGEGVTDVLQDFMITATQCNPRLQILGCLINKGLIKHRTLATSKIEYLQVPVLQTVIGIGNVGDTEKSFKKFSAEFAERVKNSVRES